MIVYQGQRQQLGTLDFSLKPPKWARKAATAVKRAVTLKHVLEAGAIVGGAILLGPAIGVAARAAAPVLARGATALARGGLAVGRGIVKGGTALEHAVQHAIESSTPSSNSGATPPTVDPSTTSQITNAVANAVANAAASSSPSSGSNDTSSYGGGGSYSTGVPVGAGSPSAASGDDAPTAPAGTGKPGSGALILGLVAVGGLALLAAKKRRAA